MTTERRGAPLDPPPVPGPGAPRRWQAASGLRPLLLRRLGPWLGLIALCLALYLPGLMTLPPIDRDEARFAQATKQMLETGDFVRIRYQDEARNKKPVGIYWAQAVSASLFDGIAAPIWAYRLPSVIAVMTSVLLLYAAGRRLFERRTAFLAASLLAPCLLAVIEAHLAKTDASLLAATVAAQGALGLLYLRGRAAIPAGWLLPLGFWLALGLGILIKGPLLPMISALTIATLGLADRSLAWFRAARPLLGLVVAAAVVAPWTLAISQATQGTFLADAIGKDLLPKLISGQESHGAPPGYYAALLIVGFFPASLHVVPALRAAWRHRLLPAERFCLAWALPAWLVFELVPTKLPHYVLPLYPALALITARFVIAGLAPGAGAPRWWARGLFGVWFAVALAFTAAAVALPILLDHRIDWIAALPMVAALVVGGAALVYAWRGDALKSTIAAVAAAGVMFATILGTVLPRLQAPWLSRSAAEMVAAERGATGEPVVAAGYAEPSLVFLLGTDTQLTGGDAAAAHLAAHPTALALVADDHEAAFHQRVAALGFAVQELGRTTGYNYSRGRWTTLALYRRLR